MRHSNIFLYFIVALFTVIGASAQQFELVTNTVFSSSLNASRASAFIDVNNDEWLDIFVTNGPRAGQNNQLYINDGSGGFNEVTNNEITSDNTPSDGVTFGDINNDGYLDGYVANWYGQKNRFYFGTLDGSFEEVAEGDIIQTGYSETASWGDYDRDGFLDLYIANSNNGANVLLKNSKKESFDLIDNILNDDQFNTRNANWIDYDQDGDLDVFLTNEFGEANQFFIHNEGEFIPVTEGAIVTDLENSVSSNWIDYDNDGDFDLYVTNIDGQNNILYQNNGGTFSRNEDLIISQDDNSGFGSTWGDIDNDGDLDLYVTNAFTNAKTTNNLYLNNGDGTFRQNKTDISTIEEGWSYAGAFGDYDNDGYLDLITTRTFDQAESNLMFHNVGGENNWLNLVLEGTVSNRSAIGAIVKLTATIEGKEVHMMREVSAQHGYNCFNSLRVHFGLRDAKKVDEIRIIWPSGQVEILTDVEVNQFLKYEEMIPEGFIRVNFKIENLQYFPGDEIKIIDRNILNTNSEYTFSWDLESDGTIDFEGRNTSLTYEEAGGFILSLTVSNGNDSETFSRKLTIEAVPLTRTTTNDRLKIYPNPANGVFNVLTATKLSEIQLIDIHGKSQPLRSSELADGFDISNMAKGHYIFSARTGKGVFRERIIID